MIYQIKFSEEADLKESGNKSLKKLRSCFELQEHPIQELVR
jgi:hypothetical protein